MTFKAANKCQMSGTDDKLPQELRGKTSVKSKIVSILTNHQQDES